MAKRITKVTRTLRFMYEFVVPSIDEETPGWCYLYELEITFMPVVGHKVWVNQNEDDLDVDDLVVSEVQHYLSESADMYTGTISCEHIKGEELNELHKLLKSLGADSHSMI